MPYPHLFSPIRLGNVEVPNRTAMAPMGTRINTVDETWPRRQIRYFEERAIGGIGLIITTFTRVHPTLASFHHIGIYDDRFIPSHRELVDRIHRHGAKIFLQIALSGGKRSPEAPSSIYSPNYYARPRELTADELDELVESFIAATGRARDAGYDGVELHGAHSYLVGQMMSPALNQRNDRYGGSFEGRMKFPSDIVRGIAARYPGFPVGFKFSAHEELPGGVEITLACDIARHMAAHGVVYLHVASTASTIDVASRYPSVPTLYIPRNTLMPLARKVKEAVPDVPVMATGSITVPAEADAFIADGSCDMVALGRTILADAHWARKAKEGKRPVPCIRCGVCYLQLWYNKPLWCSVNPYLLHEAEQDLPPLARKKRVMIVGAGPAGIQCALTASKRGHDVTLYEKQSRVGGMIVPGSRPKCKEDVALLLDWYEAELKESAVRVVTGVEVTPAMIDAERPDTLVLAVGAEPAMPDVPGVELPHAVTAVDVLRDVSRYEGKRAVVVGGGDVGCETACHLNDNGWKVTIVESLSTLMERNDNTNVKLQMLELIGGKDIEIMTGTRLSAVTPDGCEVILTTGKAWGIGADLVAMAVGFKEPESNVTPGTEMHYSPMKGILSEMAMMADEVHVIGDCTRPARIRDAVEAGERLARWL